MVKDLACRGQWCWHYPTSSLTGHCSAPGCPNSVPYCPVHGRRRRPVWVQLATPLASLALGVGVALMTGAASSSAGRWIGGSVLVLCCAALIALVVRIEGNNR